MTRDSHSNKRNGAYYTPEGVAALLVRAAVRSPGDRLLDPACGDGRFLAHHPNSTGVERDGSAARAARQRVPAANVYNDDFFAWARRAHQSGERFDCVVGNPPFIRYQTFNGTTRRAALALCEEIGVAFSGLAASWAPFLAVAASLLRVGGCMAFVVPASIGHAPYAGPLLEYLVGHFRSVRVIAVRRKLFPRLSEDCWLLFADGFGEATDEIGFAAVETIQTDDALPRPTIEIDVAEWRSAWHRRLRPYLLDGRTRTLYQQAAAAADTSSAARTPPCARRPLVRLGHLASIDLGYVSGANEFFHLTPSAAAKAGIPQGLLQTTVRSARALPEGELTPDAVGCWRRNNDPMLLLRIPKTAPVPAKVRRYLDGAEGQRAREAYKCRHRNPWYSVPDVRVPDFFLSYMAGRAASLVRNAAGAACTNALHAVRLRTPTSAGDLLGAWRSPLANLSCELEGHALGGGMLKLEIKEASRVLLPLGGSAPQLPAAEIKEAVSVMRRWRHYAD